ncbi:MAG: alanine racemase [Acidimicrobiia bacterium]|jgi:alanine racemase
MPAGTTVDAAVPGFRPAWVTVDLDAIRDNVRGLAALAAPAGVLATVKADAYGHGAVPVARAALAAGATWLGVAFVEEGVELRDAGIDAPVLLLSEPPPAAAATVVARRLTPFVYTAAGIDALAAAAGEAGTRLAVHLKVDTGMHRVGCPADDAVGLAERIAGHDTLVLEGLATHLAVADEAGHAYTDAQLATFDAVVAAVTEAVGRPPILHAANSAGALAYPRARFDLVRVGITMYGIAPAPEVAVVVPLHPALSLHARVSFVKNLPAGARVSYGLRYELAQPSRVVTVPVGYADGVPRGLGSTGGAVLVGGRRCPIAGTVTMDQLLVDVGDADVRVDDEVVLLGTQGDEAIDAQEWAERLDTIPYEVVTRLGGRLPRRHVSGGAVLDEADA